jgi:uncharacterized protein YuzE
MISQTLDLDADALYIRLTDDEVTRTVQVDKGTLVDLDPAGAVVGIEIIQPARTWPLEEILGRFGVSEHDARELWAYFSPPAQLSQPVHPGPRVPVAVG